MTTYYVAQYPKDLDDGKQIGSNMTFKDAKELADKTPEDYEREVYADIENRRTLIYTGKFK